MQSRPRAGMFLHKAGFRLGLFSGATRIAFWEGDGNLETEAPESRSPTAGSQRDPGWRRGTVYYRRILHTAYLIGSHSGALPRPTRSGSYLSVYGWYTIYMLRTKLLLT